MLRHSSGARLLPFWVLLLCRSRYISLHFPTGLLEYDHALPLVHCPLLISRLSAEQIHRWIKVPVTPRTRGSRGDTLEDGKGVNNKTVLKQDGTVSRWTYRLYGDESGRLR